MGMALVNALLLDPDSYRLLHGFCFMLLCLGNFPPLTTNSDDTMIYLTD